MKPIISYISLLLFFTSLKIQAQFDDSSFYRNFNAEPRYESGVRIVFYNVENLFDIRDDSLKNDKDFTPEGRYHWDYYKYTKKLTNIYKTLIAVGGWEIPSIIGFCEVENRYVIDQLIDHTPLSQYTYEVIHQDSPDERGIDVALIYRPVKFKPVFYEAIRVDFPSDPDDHTRDILYVKGVLLTRDTLHLYVNHWPSRSGGITESDPKRARAATILKHHVDSVFCKIPASRIVIMGDFNDEPGDESISHFLGAKSDTVGILPSEIVDLMAYLPKREGSHKYRESWGYLDHIMVSGTLIEKSPNLHLGRYGAQVFKAPFLLEDDPHYLGKKPFRTYAGPKYLGGYSDHLPVYVDLLYY